MAKETAHRIGLEGLHEIKEWLEATTRFAFSYTVWDSEPMCTRECPDGTKKALDLEGNTVGMPDERPRPVSVECKKYSTVGGQAQGYREFLAVAYANTVHTINSMGVDAERDFLWVTYHPFSQKKWSELVTVTHLRGCVEEYSGLLQGAAIDDDLLSKVAQRIGVLVVHQRQVDLRLTKDEAGLALYHLRKEGYRA
ncbi:hypothetical protein [Gordonia otitidis]|uniref:Restriction endonuclease type IV Mrr domain-containing protein n=1 Tax=Gordonia otitidis (strain DSM 44809 / CCUG 52243 / JCM 12355 / NBRC 100426 / IFM 10032) TaxID=1108044 RepID=H5TIQ2_GORO1|nr:hypothetical protein [Gordonia otitidis]GAB33360.1 hypothetical protein GOOTI_063_00310 [Gordonia otitidis NBRC 100426]